MMKSSKMMISEQNHQTFMCNDPEIFEQIYQEPFSLVKMVSSGELKF